MRLDVGTCIYSVCVCVCVCVWSMCMCVCVVCVCEGLKLMSIYACIYNCYVSVNWVGCCWDDRKEDYA